jgi:hypothetical protein
MNESAEFEVQETFQSPEEIKYARRLKRTKQSVFILLVLVALNTIAALFLGQVIKAPDYSNGSSQISTAISSGQINALSSTTVYQQQVVNGWVARDLLEAIGNQNATIIDQNSDQLRLQAFLLFNILFTLGAICIAVIRIGLVRIEQNEYLSRN